MIPARRSWTFGPFEITDSGELWKRGEAVKLAPQPARMLALIVAAEGALVTREQLRAAVWADGTTVEFDQGLNYCLRQIRIALDDDARRPTYIQTIPKRGYRLVATVNQPPEAASSPPRVTTDQPRRPLYAVAAAIIAMILIGVVMRHRGAASAIHPEAQRLFVEAEHLVGAWEADKVADAARRYEQVLQIEPQFAAAWAGLSNAQVVLTFLGPDPAKALTDSERSARRAVQLDGSLAIAHAALGHSYWNQWRWKDAEREFQLAAQPSESAVAHQLLGLYLASTGRSADAIAHARRAVELAPVSGVVNYSLARVYLQAGRFEETIAASQRTLEIDRHFPLAYHTLLRAYSRLGRSREAFEAFDTQARYTPDGGLVPWKAYLLARQDDADSAHALLNAELAREGRKGGPIAWAAALTAVGDVDTAFRVLDQAITAHVAGMIWLETTPELEAIRPDPRYAALVARLHAS